jgi:hypothetical protein
VISLPPFCPNKEIDNWAVSLLPTLGRRGLEAF